MKTRFALAFGLLVGVGFLYGAIGSWIGVAQAEEATRTPGVVRDVQCDNRSSCSGLFTSDNGTIRARRVSVSGAQEKSQPQRATYVPRIGNGLNGAIQSDDTAYVGSVTLDVATSVLIAIGLTVLGLLFTLPYVLIGVLYLGRRRR